jgi:hypothetical protein
MLKQVALVSTLLSTLILAGCQTASVNDKENMLAAAGFVPKPADTPAKLAKLKSFQPHKFTQMVQNGQMVYVYADPTICKCMYFGTQANYAQYRQMVFAQNIANEQQMTAMMNQDAAFDWGMWGWGPY